MRSKMTMKTEWLKGFGVFIMALTLLITGCSREEPDSASKSQPEVSPPAEVAETTTKVGNGQGKVKKEGVADYSPYVKGYPQKVFFGDTHVHTAISNDAFAAGNTLGPEEAYRFARGDEIVTSQGEKVRLNQPLDFLVVADHAEAYGGFQQVYAGNPKMMKDSTVREWHEMLKSGTPEEKKELAFVFTNAMFSRSLPEVLYDPKLFKSLWTKHLEITEKYNDPGKFTAFQGYEWTSNPKGANLHRVVIFKDGKDKVGQILPLSSYDSEDPEDLWRFFTSYQERTGGDVLSIAHNGNWASGKMFDVQTLSGGPITKAYAEERMKWEPLYEVTQMKGDGEAHPMLSPDDEFADYETWDMSFIGVPKTVERLKGEYGRSGLKRGLELEAKTGANPYKFGLIGSTDTHTSLAIAEEESVFGKISADDRQYFARWMGKMGDFTPLIEDLVGSGYAAVWATENTREAIFDAMRRKETYATTGPRMLVRFFGGWDFEAEDANTRLPGEAGYKKGVPMGGDLTKPPKGKAPTFLLAALKDVFSGNLDRIQVVKGWLDNKGKAHEKVYDVVWSGDRKPDANGKLPPVGNTVDLKKATWTNTIGVPVLITVWKDPDFNPKQKAFYYARVIEIPTPRWTAYAGVRYKTKMRKDVLMMTQERAYTSPIWYTPGK